MSDETLANVFINGIMSSTSNGFHVVADFINEDPSFVVSPSVSKDNHHEFTLILLIGNLSFLETAFEPVHASQVESIIYNKLAKVYGMSELEFKGLVNDYRSLMHRLNAPSKNTIYGMSKVIFDKYQLYNFQDEYFRRMSVANPLFLKRLNMIVESFVWDWENFFRKYKFD